MMGARHHLVALEPHQAAFVLQRHPIVARGGRASVAAVRASLRRSERLMASGVLSGDLLSLRRPALPVSYDGAGRRRVPVSAVRELVSEDELAARFLEAIVSRRLRCPRRAGTNLPAPSFYQELHRL